MARKAHAARQTKQVSPSRRTPLILAAALAVAGVVVVLVGAEMSGGPAKSSAVRVAPENAAPAGAQPAKPDAPAATPTPTPAAPPRKFIDPRLSSVAPGRPIEGKQPATPAPPSPLVFEPDVMKLGRMPQRSTKSGEVMLRNPTDQPITLDHVRSSCACTTTDSYKGKVLQPGESIPLKAVVESKSDLGEKKNLKLFVIVKEHAPMEVPIHFEVVQAVRAEPSSIPVFPDTPERPADPTQGVIKVESLDGSTFRIVSSNGREPVYVDNFDPSQAPRGSYKIKWDVSEYITADPFQSSMPWWWVIETDHPSARVIPIRIRSLYTSWAERPEFNKRSGREWSWMGELHVNAGAVVPGQPVELTMSTQNLATVNIVKVETWHPELISDAELVGVEVVDLERKCTFRMTPHKDHRGVFQGELVFTDSEGKQMGLWVVGTAR